MIASSFTIIIFSDHNLHLETDIKHDCALWTETFNLFNPDSSTCIVISAQNNYYM